MQMKSTSQKAREPQTNFTPPIRTMADRRLDFSRQVPLRKSYIVASTPRCGSTFFCKELWQTGVLGAPSEYINYRNRATARMIGYRMVERLNAATPAEYFEKLLACRTTRNGIFGLKTHFDHFEAAYEAFPGMLDALAPVTFIYIDRENIIAQAVSFAKALQTDTWTSLNGRKTGTLKYDRELISKSIVRLEHQKRAWHRWFAANGIKPFVVTYEKLAADKENVIRSVVELLGAQNDEPEPVNVPTLEKESDNTNKEWIARFEEENRTGVIRSEPDDRAPAPPERAAAKAKRGSAARPASEHFFDRFGRFGSAAPADAARTIGFVGTVRSRHRYEAIVGKNRELFRNARVLDIASGDGLWSMAALDAGAAHVVGIEPDPSRAALATRNFADYKIKPKSFQIIESDVAVALDTFKPGAFDLVLCREFLSTSDPRQLFGRLRDLKPKHVILDTPVIVGKGPILRFGTRNEFELTTEPSGPMLSVPNHELIEYMCSYFGFRWRLIDWRTLGITDWDGVRDYERDRRRTYVIEPAA